MNVSFERNKLTRLIKTQGQTYTFVGKGENEFGEPSDETITTTLKGVYHETQGYVMILNSDSGRVKGKPQSLIMCLVGDSSQVKTDMVVTIRGKDYKVTDLRDVNNLGVACDISLEVVLK